MEVKKEFTQTEIGNFPKNWETKPLKSLSSFITKGATPTTYGYEWEKEGVLFLRSECVSEDGLDLSQSMYISPKAHNALIRGEVHSGDILMTITGNVGRFILLGNEFGFANTNQHIARIRIIDPNAYAEYVYHFLSQPSVRKYYNSITTGQAYPQTSLTQVRDTEIPLPPLSEQHAIAAALSDMDSLLTALDSLIAKKRLVKQGAMQELLTGKRRLPAFDKKQGYKNTEIGVFPNDWEILPLKSISSMHGRIGWQGLKQTEFTMNADDPFLITGMNFKDGEIRWEEVYHIPDERYEIAKEIQLKTGDVLMTKDGTIGKILYVDDIPYPGKASLNSHLLVFRPLNKKYIPKFMFYQLNSKTFHNHIEVEKSGTTFFGITQEAVGKYNAFLPSIPEQQAIAEILSDMDAEINALESRREKTRQLKAGMMQELLTGRIRLL